MHHFTLKNGELHAENCRVDDLARKFGTPLYVYSASTVADHYDRLTEALSPLDHMICYALKANSNLAILRLLAKRGCGFDLVSGGELERVKKAGGAPGKCTFAGVGKTRDEIANALRAGVYSFNIESEAELEFIDQVAGDLKKTASIAARVNPNIDAGTHAKITTGTYENKFGIAFERIGALYARAAKLKNVRLRGVQMHIGSQITQVKPFVSAVKKMIPLVLNLKGKYGLEFFDIGGGLGIVYQDALASGQKAWWKRKQPPLTPAVYARELLPLLSKLKLKILVEPGRFMVGNAGILVSEVLYVKKTGHKTFVIVDAAMNDLVRPAFYDSYHEIVPLRQGRAKRPLVKSDVVGPICESGDYFAKDRPLPPLEQGDRIALLSSGAYGFVMASNYNTRPRAAEVLVEGSKARVVRKRETVSDLLRGETV